MRLPLIARIDPFRAWCVGIALAVATVLLPFATLWFPLPMPLASAFYLVPIGFAVLALYSLTVEPRALAASGVLLGVAPFFAWGVIDGLQKCARFNRGGPSGGCEADPSAQVVLTALVYAAALLMTGLAVWSSRRAR